jgi:Uma2 family endonuclease
MPIATATHYLEAIAHLAVGTSLRVDDVAWEEYEQLLSDLSDNNAVRVYYDHGRMEIMSPLRKHEAPVGIIARLMSVLSDELELDIEPLGSTTLKSEMQEQGAEPDASFYVQHAAAVIGKDDLDLAHDPPPDIVIESDLTSSSLDKFPIYVGLGVPEIWHIAKRRVRIFVLVGTPYQDTASSFAFPFLSAQALTKLMSRGLNEGATAAARTLRDWMRKHLPQV